MKTKLILAAVLLIIFSLGAWHFYFLNPDAAQSQPPEPSAPADHSRDSSPGAPESTFENPESSNSAAAQASDENNSQFADNSVSNSEAEEEPLGSAIWRLEELSGKHLPSDLRSTLAKSTLLRTMNANQERQCAGTFQALLSGRDGKPVVLKLLIGVGSQREGFAANSCLNLFMEKKKIFSSSMSRDDLKVFRLPQGHCAISGGDSLYVVILSDVPRTDDSRVELAIYRRQPDGGLRLQEHVVDAPPPPAQERPEQEFCEQGFLAL